MIDGSAPPLYPDLPFDPLNNEIGKLINNISQIVEGNLTLDQLRKPIKEKVTFIQLNLADQEVTEPRTKCLGILNQLTLKMDRQPEPFSFFGTMMKASAVGLAVFVLAPAAVGIMALALLGEPTAIFIVAATAFGVIVWNTTGSQTAQEAAQEITYSQVVDQLKACIDQI